MSEIHKMLALSTAHLSPDTAEVFDEKLGGVPSGMSLIIYPHGEYGWLIPIHDEIENDALPPDLVLCLKHAKTLGCTWVLFDRDAPSEDNLPTWEW